jgi:hypothetical protein
MEDSILNFIWLDPILIIYVAFRSFHLMYAFVYARLWRKGDLIYIQLVWFFLSDKQPISSSELSKVAFLSSHGRPFLDNTCIKQKGYNEIELLCYWLTSYQDGALSHLRVCSTTCRWLVTWWRRPCHFNIPAKLLPLCLFIEYVVRIISTSDYQGWRFPYIWLVICCRFRYYRRVYHFGIDRGKWSVLQTWRRLMIGHDKNCTSRWLA